MPGNVRPVADERDGLLAFLAQQRDAIRIAAYGLTDQQARSTPTPSALSVGGLVKEGWPPSPWMQPWQPTAASAP